MYSCPSNHEWGETIIAKVRNAGIYIARLPAFYFSFAYGRRLFILLFISIAFGVWIQRIGD